MRAVYPLILCLAVMICGCVSESPHPEPPVAKIDATVFEEFGHRRVDDYYWLNQREDPEVIDYLTAENDYRDTVSASTDGLREELFDEIVGRIKKDDDTVPYLDRGHWYYRRYEEGLEYPVHCRRAGSLESAEEIMIDANERAEGHGYYAMRGPTVTDGGSLIAFAEDTVGRRLYTIRFKDLATGAVLDESIPDVSGNMVWAADDRTLFYTKKDLQTLRTHQVWRHALGTDPADDVLVYEEQDDTFGMWVTRTSDRTYLMIGCSQTLASEYRVLAADDPEGAFEVFEPRERGHEYSLDHLGDRWFVRTNWEARNFRFMGVPEHARGRDAWEDVVPHRDDVFFMRAALFDDWFAVLERRDGLRRLRVIDRATGDDHEIDMGETAFAIWPSVNRVQDTDVLRLGYESMTTPESTYDYDMRTREATLLKQAEVLGGFDRADYATERITARARDGVEVPISVVRRADTPLDGTAPLLLYAYGSYGSSMEPYFNSARLSLLDRGFVYAVAHVRGGQEMGRWWYEDGKLLKKKNTFNDFIDCGRHLALERYGDPARLYAMGGSAGGLLVGAVANMEPGLFHGIVAQVPFVDVITTMLDDSIPLTTVEYDEWGDPHLEEHYEYMLSYSPYDQVEAKAYPNLFVSTGLHDSQVQYWEPAKWVAKLRAFKTDDNLLILSTNMEAGHGGASGRFRRYRETAREYAFLLDLAGSE